MTKTQMRISIYSHWLRNEQQFW